MNLRCFIKVIQSLNPFIRRIKGESYVTAILALGGLYISMNIDMNILFSHGSTFRYGLLSVAATGAIENLHTI